MKCSPGDLTGNPRPGDIAGACAVVLGVPVWKPGGGGCSQGRGQLPAPRVLLQDVRPGRSHPRPPGFLALCPSLRPRLTTYGGRGGPILLFPSLGAFAWSLSQGLVPGAQGEQRAVATEGPQPPLPSSPQTQWLPGWMQEGRCGLGAALGNGPGRDGLGPGPVACRG